MASYKSISIISSLPKLPPGFRFHPSDEELIVHYLRPKATSHPVPESIITEIDLYKYNPWELPQLALFGEGEWYFFTPRDRKYPKGERPNRAAGLGFWKATGTDKPIFRSSGLSNPIGVKKGLVFCSGRPPKGKKTGWSMNEYRLFHSPITSPRLAGSMRLDDWVLCRIRHRGSMSKSSHEVRDKHVAEMPMPEPEPGQKIHIRSGRDMFTDYLNKDSLQLALLLLGGQPVPPTDNFPSVNLEAVRNGNTQNSFTLSGYGSWISESPYSMDNCFSLKLGETSEQTDKGYLDRMKTTEDNLASQTVVENDIYGYIQNQPLYGANQIDSTFEFQAPNELEVTGKYLQYCSSSTQRTGQR